MRDLFKKILVGMVLLCSPQVFAEDYRVLVIPDNVATEKTALDSFIYDGTAEFFADEIISVLNNTDYISAPTVSEFRYNLKDDPSAMIAAKNLTSKFKSSYNVDYVTLKKLSAKANVKYALLLTSYIDAENYVLRRTFWDFLNVPGASVVDPAYKISTYAVLVDTTNNNKIWSNTFYKTISVCENRIITRGPSPQTEQLQKIKDYSRYVCPQIARNVQRNILPADLYEKESIQIDYDLGNIDNVFTKKYRHLGKEYNKIYGQKKQEYGLFLEDKKQKWEQSKKDRNERNTIKQDAEYEEFKTKLEVQASQVDNDEEGFFNNIGNKIKNSTENVKNSVLKKKYENLGYPELIQIEINKKKKNNLLGDYDTSRPELRDYEF